MELNALEVYFQRYLYEKTSLKSSSIKHYADALKWISGYLRDKNLLKDSIYEISDVNRLYQFRSFLFADETFRSLNTRGNSMYSAGLNHYITFAEASDFEKHTVKIEKMDAPTAQGDYVIEQGIKRWKRSALVKDQSLHSAEFQCEISSEHKTFISASTGKQYMEGHHLIAMQKQGLFQVGLDVYANIVCLCPICHRKLHYATGEQKRPSLYQLYELRKDRLANSGILLSKEEFIRLTI